MDFLRYIIAQIDETKNSYKSGLYIKPPYISNVYNNEINFRSSETDEIYLFDYETTIIPLNFTAWNPSQKATLVKILTHNSLWNALSGLMTCISYEHTWAFSPKIKKDLINFINILKISKGWKPLAYYYVIEIFRKFGTNKYLCLFIFANSRISVPEFLINYDSYVQASQLYLKYLRAIMVIQHKYKYKYNHKS